MDYEVFLLSRMREEWDRTHDNEHSVAYDLEHTGRIRYLPEGVRRALRLAPARGSYSFACPVTLAVPSAVWVVARISSYPSGAFGRSSVADACRT
jgi:uncharacterized membrane protein YdfJ with MMPL/SSD domain